MNKTLYIFDYDGTLVEPFTTNILPGVKEWFSKIDVDTTVCAIATNQGGVGLRYQMGQEGWGEPEKYPTGDEICDSLIKVRNELVGGSGVLMPIYVCFRYQSKKGVWCPTPYDATPAEAAAFAYNDKEPQAFLATTEDDLPNEWKKAWRKPNGGMLIAARNHFSIPWNNTVMAGDSEEDECAANGIGILGIRFIHADTFFGR